MNASPASVAPVAGGGETRELTRAPDALPATGAAPSRVIAAEAEPAPAARSASEPVGDVSAAAMLLERVRATGWPRFHLQGLGPVGGSEAAWRAYVARADDNWTRRALAALELWLEHQPDNRWAEKRFRKAQTRIAIPWGSRPAGLAETKDAAPPAATGPGARWGLAMLSPDGAALLEAGEALGWPRLVVIDPCLVVPAGEYPWLCWVANAGMHSTGAALMRAREVLDRERRESNPTSNPTPEIP